MRIVALLAAYNERRFIEPCLKHLREQGVDAYLIDNGSSDDTVRRAERWLDRGLIGIESFPRGVGGSYDWRGLLRRKEELAQELEADWFIHMDPDEVRLAPPGQGVLAEALGAVERQGYNAVNFSEFTFIPTREAPEHDHPAFERTLRSYYPFCPAHPHQLKAWKAGAASKPELAGSGGHQVSFPGLRMYPVSFPMKHYLFLSVAHAIEKYVLRRYDAGEVKAGWHGWRARLRAGDLLLPEASELRLWRSDEELDGSEPRRRHYVEELLGARASPNAERAGR